MQGLRQFHPALETWFLKTLGEPTQIQKRAWDVLARREHALLSAPTGSGKTLAGFLSVINDLLLSGLEGSLSRESRVLYISPLKALSHDVEKNLQVPLEGLRAELASSGLPDPGITVMVRTGDTSSSERSKMFREKPHIIVTTPESLYILLTSESGRTLLSSIDTVIVDEIHALVANRRGAHLALSLERLQRIVPKKLHRIGLSATVKPLERVASFLSPDESEYVHILDEGHKRKTDIRMLLPDAPLDSVMSQDGWADVTAKLIQEMEGRRTSLIFVNNRRLCERLARQLSELIGQEKVAAHHGSLSHPQRKKAEQALKDGSLKVMVATSSLELGIDIGSIDLVVQIASPRSIHGFLQRIGRSEHHKEGTSRAVLVPLTRDDLIESAALLRAVKKGALEETDLPEAPLDVLAQQIVAETAAGEISADELFETLRRSRPYRSLSRERFEQILEMLVEGYAMRFGRRSRYLFYDKSRGMLAPRRGARLMALLNGGAIPENFEYEVILEGEGTFLGSVHEDFAIESIAGDVFQLGNQFWRITRISTGKVLVQHAPHSTPTMPFWIAEAPGRTNELSAAVSDLRADLEERLSSGLEGFAEFLEDEAGISGAAASQIYEYLAEARRVLGVLPTHRRIVIERFFDEAGDSHIVVHSPFGTRINRAWGLALRKRFCRKFNFELQAAATDDAILFSLSKTHSFALAEVFSYIKVEAARGLLEQAVLVSPMFEIRWRWNASRSLAILRQYGSRRTPPQIQKTQAQDLVALVFPDQIACAENLAGEREIPDHPLVDQTMRDCLTEAMDLDGWTTVLQKLDTGEILTTAVDSPAPSVLAHEIVNARPYAFLDDAPLEERRSRAVRTDMRPIEDESDLPDPALIAKLRAEAVMVPRDSHELYDLLTTFGVLDVEELGRFDPENFAQVLLAEDRARRMEIHGREFVIPADRFQEAAVLFPEFLRASRAAPENANPPDPHEGARIFERALDLILRGHLELCGPMSGAKLAGRTGLAVDAVEHALIRYEVEGWLFRIGKNEEGTIWCERTFYQRLQHARRSYAREREADPLQFLEFLARWQHLTPDTRLGGETALEAALFRLEGSAMSVEAWHAALSVRVENYKPAMLDRILLTGNWLWWKPVRTSDPARKTVTRNVPVMLISRESIGLLPAPSAEPLSHYADTVQKFLRENGASFLPEIREDVNLLPDHTIMGLKELIARGLVGSDSLAGLLSLFRERKTSRFRRLPVQAPPGRWFLLRRGRELDGETLDLTLARLFLRRTGFVFRYLSDREFLTRPWTGMVRALRRLEMQGEIRGGRFIRQVWGEQFALPSALTGFGSPAGSNADEREASLKDILSRLPSADPFAAVHNLISGVSTAKSESSRG